MSDESRSATQVARRIAITVTTDSIRKTESSVFTGTSFSAAILVACLPEGKESAPESAPNSIHRSSLIHGINLFLAVGNRQPNA